MPYNPSSPSSIRPHKWTNLNVVYFDGFAALITGNYDGDPIPCVGMRWMRAEGPQGYPVTSGHPTWMVLPCKIAIYVIQGALDDTPPSGPDTVFDPEALQKALINEQARRAREELESLN